MKEELLWSIGSPDGKAAELVDTYKEPNLLGDVVWRVPQNSEDLKEQRWPAFHPSEADPDAGYRQHPYTILFSLPDEPQGAYVLRLHYLAITPRLADLEVVANGFSGYGYLRPTPSQSGEIRLQSSLHTTIYAEGVASLIIPAALLRKGENRLVLISRDGGETIRMHHIEAIRRLDRIASGAGLVYQQITFSRLSRRPADSIATVDIKPSVLYRQADDGSLSERCYLYLELGRPIETTHLTLELRGAGRTEQLSLPLPATSFGHLSWSFELFDGQEPVEYILRGQVNGERFEHTGRLVRRRKWRVYVTPHAHTDIGYTHRQWEVAERLCRNIDAALDLLEPEPDVAQRPGCPSPFAYHLDSSWALETYLATRGERRRRQLIEGIRAGRIGVPGIYVDLLTQYAALEDLIRNGVFTEELLRPEGLRTDFSTVVDVASLSGSLPTVLAGSGIKYLVHANNQDRGPFRLNGGLHQHSPFYWQGADGGTILVWLSKMYCELRKVCGSPPVLSSAERGLELWLDEYERESYAPDVVMLYGQEADNTDLDPQPVDFIRRWNETYAYPQLIPCNVSEFFQEIEAQFGDSLSTFKGDGGAYWEDGVGSSIALAAQVRQAQATVPAAERLEALAALHDDDAAYPQRHFDEAWKQVLLFDEHTWGAFLSCRDPEALLQQDQWAVKEHMGRDAVQWASRLLHSAATRHSLRWNNAGREVVVYNPHSWEVSGPVIVEIAAGEWVCDAATGEEVPARCLRRLSTQAIIELWIDRLPGLSYRRLVLRDAAQAGVEQVDPSAAERVSQPQQTHTEQVVLENSFYRLVFDLQRGCLSSWFDKILAKELVEIGDVWGFGQLLYARGGEGTRLTSNQADLPDGNPEVLAEFQLHDYILERFAFGTSLRVRGRVPYGELEMEWTLQDRVKRIDVRYTYRKQERTAKEAVYIGFPLALPDAAVSSDSQLGWVNWDADQLPGGCKEWLPLQTSILVSQPEAAVLIASPDIPLFCIGDVVRGRWPKELSLSGGRILSYVLNNYWHTNYKASQGGEVMFHYHLTSAGSIGKAMAFKFGWEARRPLHAQRMSYQAFRQPEAPYDRPGGGTLAWVSSDCVALSTMKKASWADGFVLRLQELAGSDQTTAVSFPGKTIVQAWETDLLERDVRAIPVEPDGCLQISVPAWGLATVRLLVE